MTRRETWNCPGTARAGAAPVTPVLLAGRGSRFAGMHVPQIRWDSTRTEPDSADNPVATRTIPPKLHREQETRKFAACRR